MAPPAFVVVREDGCGAEGAPYRAFDLWWNAVVFVKLVSQVDRLALGAVFVAVFVRALF